MAHSPTPDVLKQCGVVRTGDLPLAGAEVTLLQAGRGTGTAPRVLAHVRTGSHGEFGLIYRRPVDPTAVLYLTADVGRPSRERSSAWHPAAPVELAAALGSPSSATTPTSASPVVINERTTVAAGYALAQFIGDRGVSGTYPGLQNAAAISHNLADVTTGQIAPLLASPPNGALTSTLATFNTLADLVAGCVAGQTCQSLFALAQPPGKAQPTNTLQAVADIARTPGNNVLMMSANGVPQRSITTGGLRRPLGIASDSLGNVWVANPGILPVPCRGDSAADFANAVQNAPSGGGGVGGIGGSVTMIGPDGSTPAQPFTNGGIVLPWGVAVDGDDTVWVSNFGGQRLVHLCGARLSSCPPGYRAGQPISPAATGYTSDSLARNTGVQIDPSGNVWLANNWLTVPVQTNPGAHEMVVFIGMAAPVRTPLLGAPRRP